MDFSSEFVIWKLLIGLASIIAMIAIVGESTPISVLFLYTLLAGAMIATSVQRVPNGKLLAVVGVLATAFGLWLLATDASPTIVSVGYLIAGAISIAIGYSYPFGSGGS